MSGVNPHGKAVALKVVISASASLAVMIADLAWLMRGEVKYVWSRLCTSWTARMYILARYIGLASQIFNVCFAVRMYRGVHTSPRGCRLWFAYQAIVVQFLLFFVQGLLMHRLYVLFLHNRAILMVLAWFAVCQMVSMAISARISLPSNQYTATCLMVKANLGNVFFSSTTLTISVIIFFMTFWRYLRVPAKFTRRRLGRVIFRDSALSSSAIAVTLISIVTVIMLFLTLCSFEVIKPTMSGNITYCWLVCVLWISIGRIIVNYEKVPRDEGEQQESSTRTGTLQLTSLIEMDQCTLSVDTEYESVDGHSSVSGTLQSSPSTPVTKSSQFSTSSVTGDSSPRGLGEGSELPSSEGGDRRRHSRQPSSTELPMEVSMRRRSSRFNESDSGAPQAEDHPGPDADGKPRAQSPTPSQQSGSEPPSPQVVL